MEQLIVTIAKGLVDEKDAVQVTVDQPDEISYASAAGEAVQFRAADFNNDCLSRTGSNLRYVVFSLPDSSRGTLYRDYISPDSPGVELRSTDRLLLSGSPSVVGKGALFMRI